MIGVVEFYHMILRYDRMVRSYDRLCIVEYDHITTLILIALPQFIIHLCRQINTYENKATKKPKNWKYV